MWVRPIFSRVPAAFALVLWFGATFYFLGDTGKHSDDYTVAMRHRDTGAVDLSLHPWTRWPYFWRPLHLAHASAINTISWNHPWIGHLELAVIHGLVAWMLAGLLTRLGVRRPIAWIIALLFLVCPLEAEAVLWTTASCNAVSSLFLLWTLELVRRQSEGPATTARLAWIAALAFVTACWYEPAAAALAAVPAVFIAAGRGPVRARLNGAMRCTLSAGLGCLLYVGLLIATAPPKNRGGAESLISLHDVGPRSRFILRGGVHAIIGERGRDVIAGSIANGLQTLHTPLGMAFAGIAVVLAVLSLAAIISNSQNLVDDMPPVPDTRGGLLLAGAAIFLCSWIPIIAVSDQVVELRSLYVPMLGIAIMASALATGAANLIASASLTTRRSIATLACMGAFVAAIAGAVGMIGFQSEFRLNALHDHNTAEQLKRLVPEPPPNTLFLPLRIDTHGAATGRPYFDRAIHGVFDTPWSCRTIMHTVYHRPDVSASPTPSWIKNLDARGFTFLHTPAFLTWDRCVPFVVGPAGEVRLVRRITIVPGEGAPLVVEFPHIPPQAPADDSGTIRLREVDHGTDHAHSVADIPGA